MLVIVEGIDRVGKTTLCNMLSKEIDFPIFKLDALFGCEDMKRNNEVNNAILQLQRCTKFNAILDRFELTEFAYGFTRGYDCSEYYDKLLKITPDDTILIYVKPTDINRSIKEHGGDLFTQHILFESLYKKWPLKKFDTKYEKISDCVKDVKKYISGGK